MFPVGQDEGTVEAMFTPGTPIDTGHRFDALLVVRMRFRFIFDDTLAKKAQWVALNRFHRNFYDDTYREQVPFQLVGGKRFRRMAVLFHPAYDYGPPGNGLFHSDPSNFVIHVISLLGVPEQENPLTADGVPNVFRLGLSDTRSPWPFVRLALNWTSWVPSPDGKSREAAIAPIAVSTIGHLAARIDELLGDPPGTRHGLRL